MIGPKFDSSHPRLVGQSQSSDVDQRTACPKTESGPHFWGDRVVGIQCEYQSNMLHAIFIEHFPVVSICFVRFSAPHIIF